MKDFLCSQYHSIRVLLLKLKSYHDIQSQRDIVQSYFVFHAVSYTMQCDAMHDKIIRVYD